MATGEQRGVADALRKTFTDVASMKLLPDAQNHAQFLDGLMQGIQKYLQMQAGAAAKLGAGAPQGGMGGPGGGVGGQPAGPPPGPMANAPGGGAGMTGLMGGAGGGPNPEDLKRLMGAGAPG